MPCREKEIFYRGNLFTRCRSSYDFCCSNTLFNQIHKIILQAIKSNTKKSRTDCPHREKARLAGDISDRTFHYVYNLDAANLYTKIEGDMADSQRENGLIPDICPEYVTGFG